MAKTVTVPCVVTVRGIKGVVLPVDLSKWSEADRGVLIARALARMVNDSLGDKDVKEGVQKGQATFIARARLDAWIKDASGSTREADAIRNVLRAAAVARGKAKAADAAKLSRVQAAALLDAATIRSACALAGDAKVAAEIIEAVAKLPVGAPAPAVDAPAAEGVTDTK